jgi:hypothetical protein
MNITFNNTDIRQKINTDDVRYRARKLRLGSHGTDDCWIKAEGIRVAARMGISANTRHKMIEVAAYYLAEKRGFAGQGAFDDWIKAEAEIDKMLYNRMQKY